MRRLEQLQQEPIESVLNGEWAFVGDIERLPVAAVLQFLEFGRNTGTLVCWEPGQSPSECAFQQGSVVAARHMHLVGSEAVIGMLGRTSGRFALNTSPFDAPNAPAIGVSSLIMEAVRLEDEFERLAVGYPGDDYPIRLRDPHELPLDPIGCGVDAVMATIAARGQTSVSEMVKTMNLAPIRIKISAAWLVQTERVLSMGSRMNLQAVSVHRLAWFNQLRVQFAGGLRVVLAVDMHNNTRDLLVSVKSLAEVLDSGPAWMSFGLDGTSMARVRPRAGGLLSIACVPLAEEHQKNFERFARTADLVLFCAPKTSAVATHWRKGLEGSTVLWVSDELKTLRLEKALEEFSNVHAARAPSNRSIPGGSGGS